VEYVVDFNVNDCTKFVLSNRWAVRSHIGEQYLTTRITEGHATLRLDFLNLFGTVADAFRCNFTLAVPPGFIRKRVNVTATEDGRELVYYVEDQQCYFDCATYPDGACRRRRGPGRGRRGGYCPVALYQ
jgi:hypothetical protein